MLWGDHIEGRSCSRGLEHRGTPQHASFSTITTCVPPFSGCFSSYTVYLLRRFPPEPIFVNRHFFYFVDWIFFPTKVVAVGVWVSMPKILLTRSHRPVHPCRASGGGLRWSACWRPRCPSPCLSPSATAVKGLPEMGGLSDVRDPPPPTLPWRRPLLP